MPVEYLNVGSHAEGCSDGVFGHCSCPDNNDFGRRNARDTAQDDSAPVDAIEVFARDEHNDAARNFAHSSNYG